MSDKIFIVDDNLEKRRNIKMEILEEKIINVEVLKLKGRLDASSAKARNGITAQS